MRTNRAARKYPSPQPNDKQAGWPTWTKVLSWMGGLVLLFLGAITSGLAGRVVDRIWPTAPAITNQPTSQPSGSAQTQELVIAAFSPPDVDLTCNHYVNVAGLAASPSPADLPPIAPGELVPAKDPRTIAVKELNAVGWYRSLIQIGLATANEVPAFVMKIEPVVFKRASTEPAWGLEFDPPCGGTAQNRNFKTILDKGSIEDLGVEGVGIGGKGPRDEPLGQNFTVSASDPAVLSIHAYACTGYFEWGLKITYLAQGELKEAWVGTADQPLKMIGGWRNVDRYHGLWEGQTQIKQGPKPHLGEAGLDGVPASASDVCAES